MSKGHILYSNKQIKNRISKLVKRIVPTLSAKKIVLVFILEGSRPFGELLIQEFHKYGISVWPQPITIKSYYDNIRNERPVFIEDALNYPFEDCKDVLIIDDLYETGITMTAAKLHLETISEDSGIEGIRVRTAVLVNKRGFDRAKLTLDYIGFEYTGKKWLYGFGLDDNGRRRQLPDIYEKAA